MTDYPKHVSPQLPLISVTPETLDDLKEVASSEGVKVAALVRQFIADGLSSRTGKPVKRYLRVRHGGKRPGAGRKPKAS